MSRAVRRTAGYVLAVVLSGGCAAPPVDAGGGVPSPGEGLPDGLTVELRESYYGVHGDTPAELNGALAAVAPRHRGRRAYGLTDWVLRWRYRVVPGVTRCRVTEPGIRVTLTTRLPRWEGRDRAPRRTSADWDLFLARLRHHEAGHRELVIREAARTLAALRTLAAPTCGGLRLEVEEVIHRAEDRMWEENRRYDRSTDYGLSQASTTASGR